MSARKNHQKIKRVLSGVGIPSDLGDIYHSPSSGRISDFSIMSNLELHPNLIYLPDRKIWGDFWSERAKEKGINYDYQSDTFEVEVQRAKKSLDNLSYMVIEPLAVKIATLMRQHRSASLLYNQEIAQSFIEERKTALGKILTTS